MTMYMTMYMTVSIVCRYTKTQIYFSYPTARPQLIETIKSYILKRDGFIDGRLNHLLTTWQGIDDLIVERLQISPAEEKARLAHLQKIRSKKQQYLEEINVLSNQKQAAEEAKDREIADANVNFESLQRQIKEIYDNSQAHIAQKWEEVEGVLQYENKLHESKLSNLDQQLSVLQTEFATVQRQNRDEEIKQRDKKLKIETEIHNMLQKYDSDMTQRHNNWIQINKQLEMEKMRLSTLEERIASKQQRYDDIMAYRAAKAKEEEEKRQELMRRTAAAIIIQRNWRRYLEEVPVNRRRWFLKKQKKGAKGKSKRGKGKKGKKK